MYCTVTQIRLPKTMELALILLLALPAFASVIPEQKVIPNVLSQNVQKTAQDIADEKGLIISLEHGELCLFSFQCKSDCCHRGNAVSLARCAPSAAENQECTPWTIYEMYYRCPCEAGLKCETDRTIIGSITNTDFGICKDPKDRSLLLQNIVQAPQEA